MSIRWLYTAMIGVVLLCEAGTQVNAQMTEQAAREKASRTVRSDLQSKLDFKPDRFLAVQRDEELEQSLAIAVDGQSGLFIYKVSATGIEVRESAVVYHAWPDFDVVFIVGVSQTDGSVYRIHGFGIPASLSEFEKLMTALDFKVSSADQAEAVADFYRSVNPENQENVTPIGGTLELKQAAERQCQAGADSFDAGEKAFSAWWRQGKRLYANISFAETASANDKGYLVEWVVLSNPGKGNCGGAPLRAQVEIGRDGRVGKVDYSTFRRAR